MSEKPQHRFLQIHLSTAIVLMFVAGGLLRLNIYSKTIIWVDSEGSLNVIRRHAFGWP